jgi:hypothetical protein
MNNSREGPDIDKLMPSGELEHIDRARSLTPEALAQHEVDA